SRDVLIAEVELGEVTDVPVRLGVIFPGHLDQMRVQVHPGDVVSSAGQVPAQTPAATSGMKEAGTARRHRVDQPGHTVEVLLRGASTTWTQLGGSRTCTLGLRLGRLCFEADLCPPFMEHHRGLPGRGRLALTGPAPRSPHPAGEIGRAALRPAPKAGLGPYHA